MTPVDPGDVKDYYGKRDGQFTSIRKLLKPGDTITVQVSDISKSFQTNYPIKDKDYCMRVSLEFEGVKLLLDLNGAGAIRQFMTALYPDGPEGKLVPCSVMIYRKTERKQKESEIQVTRVEPGQDEVRL